MPGRNWKMGLEEEYISKDLPDRPHGKWEGIDYRYYKQPKMKCVSCGSRYFKCLSVQKIEYENGTIREDSLWACKTCGNYVTTWKGK